MSEKRFTRVMNEFLTSFEDNGVKMTHQEIVDTLNALYCEREQLKDENEQLKKVCKTLIEYIEERSITFIIDDDVRRLLE